MRIQYLLLLLITILNSFAWADCLCGGKIGQKVYINSNQANEEECFNKQVRPFIEKKSYLELCSLDAKELILEWSCTLKNEKQEKIELFLNCADYTPIAGTEFIKALQAVNPQNPAELMLKTEDCSENLLPQKNINFNEGLGAQSVILEFDNEEQMKKALKNIAPSSILDRPVNSWQFAIHLPNDNKGFGLIDKIFKTKTGDDYGYTHGMKVSASKALNNKYHLTLEYSTDLYTQMIPGKNNFKDAGGVIHINQHFLEENLLKLVIDNIDEGKPLYYKAGVGLHNLNNDKAGSLVFSAARQQDKFHEIAIKENFGRHRAYNYIEQGQNNLGAYAEADAGVRSSKYISDSLRTTLSAEVGGAVSTADSKAANLHVKGTAQADWNIPRSKYALRTEIKAQVDRFNDSSPLQKTYGIGVTLGNKSFQCGVETRIRTQSIGATYRFYDRDRDKIVDLFCKENFK